MNRRHFLSSSLAATASLALDLPGTLSAAATSPGHTGDLSELWAPSAQLFRSALAPGSGFSFHYEGHPAGAPDSVSERDMGSSIETTFRYASGIEAIRSLRKMPEYDAIEYSVRFRNSGGLRSGVIESVNAMHTLFKPDVLDSSYVLSSGGGTYDGTYPPEAFAIRKHFISPALPSDGVVTLTTQGGRSSNRDLPFYFVHNDAHSSGIFIGIGWTGQWSSSISAEYDVDPTAHGGLRLEGGIPDIRVALEPGEEIVGPNILIGSYDGPLASGSNKLRRLIQDRYTPKLDGRKFGVIATYDAWWDIGEKYDESLLLPVADAAAAIGQEYFLLDAAWYIGSNGPEGFSGGVGNWEQVDSKKFPSGLAHFADYVRSRGLQFGLWFEPERVHRDSLLAKEHPDWVIWLDKENNYGLLDYGRVEAQRWVQDMMDRYITQLNIRYIRHDFNIDPLAYWDSHDAADRRGVSQIRHIEGFYKVIDWVRERHPATVLECCASGGRRIDLETARRFHTYWISDDSVDPEIIRFHLQGINYFLPGNYSYIQYTLPSPSQKNFAPKDFYYLSCFAGAFGVGGRVDLWPSDQKERFATIEKIHKRIRPHLMEDYYPIMPQSLDLKGWDAWQFHNPRTNSGFVQAFRQESETPSLKLRLSGLHAGDLYEFEDPLTGAKMQLTGAAATTEGPSFELTQMSSRILLYESKAAKGR
jgi:alpha-galactosidase